MGNDVSGFRILVLGTDDGMSVAVRDVLASQLPAAACECLHPRHLRSRPDASALVIDASSDASQAHETVRHVRAMGFDGGVVLIGTAEEGLSAELGTAAVAPDRLAHDLVAALATLMQEATSVHAGQVMRARRLVAAGEIALRLQHALNNPLAGLLAEAQLLQFETLTPEQRESVDRMVTLCRRMIEITRGLDGMGDRKQAPPR